MIEHKFLCIQSIYDGTDYWVTKGKTYTGTFQQNNQLCMRDDTGDWLTFQHPGWKRFFREVIEI